MAPVSVEETTDGYTTSIPTAGGGLTGRLSTDVLGDDPVIPSSGDSPLNVTEPKPYSIYSPNFGSDDIKSGSVVMGTSYRDIVLNDLEPNQLYFAYFVTQGTGQVYSGTWENDSPSG